jgi:hypothetical protein
LHYANSNSAWVSKPKFIFIIGKGIDYRNYLTHSTAPITTYPYPIIPSFGDPCSDALLTDFNFTSKSEIPIGRLPVWNGTDVKDYLNKIKDHEISISNTSNQTSDSVLWQKNVLHIAGSGLASEQIPILAALTKCENKIKDTLYGASVTTIKKSTTTSIEQANSELIDKIFKGGLNIVQFFGHGSSTALDYNLDHPDLLPNYKRYPLFIANGCSVGNVFILAVGQRSLGERFVLAPNSGSIGFIVISVHCHMVKLSVNN